MALSSLLLAIARQIYGNRQPSASVGDIARCGAGWEAGNEIDSLYQNGFILWTVIPLLGTLIHLLVMMIDLEKNSLIHNTTSLLYNDCAIEYIFGRVEACDFIVMQMCTVIVLLKESWWFTCWQYYCTVCLMITTQEE